MIISSRTKDSSNSYRQLLAPVILKVFCKPNLGAFDTERVSCYRVLYLGLRVTKSHV